MAKYRKKPVVIEAEQWWELMNMPDEVGQFFDSFSGEVCSQCKCLSMKHGWIKTLEGGHIVCPGDWIITGVKGERYSCKDAIFRLTYEKV